MKRLVTISVLLLLCAGTLMAFTSELRQQSAVPTNPSIVRLEETTTLTWDSENFVLVPAGTFTMGDTRGEGLPRELPTHSVSLDSFYMGKHQVTQAEYAAIMGSNPASGTDYGVGDNHPVYYVNRYSAIKYCNLRSMEEGLTPVYSLFSSTDPASWGSVPSSNNSTWDAAICDWDANGYRLPTEAEWEYAARGATNDPDYLYSGSDDIDEVAWYSGNTPPAGEPGGGSQPVGSKAPNALGIYDMSGNVYEWCWDWYDEDYYSNSPDNNPTGPASGAYRVYRGGRWGYTASSCRVAARGYDNSGHSTYATGLRICRAADKNVATPTFSPEPGEYEEEIFVEIFCETPLAQIYYTLDGTTPTQNSTLYSAPIAIADSTLVSARAYYQTWTPSAVATALYTISVSNPTGYQVPELYGIKAAYPNPFQDRLNIAFQVKDSYQDYKLKIYNVKGACIYTRQGMAKGSFDLFWDGRDAKGNKLPSGIYLLRFSAKDLQTTRRVILY